MTQEEILDYNKRCAEFLGLKRGWWISQQKPLTDDKKQWCDLDGKTFLDSKVYFDKDLKFHSDWNWIMELVEKIQTLDRLGGIVMIQQGRCKITSRMAGDHSVYADVSLYFKKGVSGQKEAVVQAINQFLIFYNNENS